MPTLSNQQGPHPPPSNQRKSGDGMTTRANVGSDDGRTVRLLFDNAHFFPPTKATKNQKKNQILREHPTSILARTARFTDNPHIALPTKRDLEPGPDLPQTTFPIPLPPYLPRSTLLPTTVPPAPDAKTSTAGQFGFSARGMRRALRGRHGAGPRTQALVRGVEDELVRWLRGEDDVVVVRDPDSQRQRQPLSSQDDHPFQFPGRPVAGMEDVREVERSPQRLVWWIENDTWARYVVHCCARYHNVISFSTSHPFLSSFNHGVSLASPLFFFVCLFDVLGSTHTDRLFTQVKTPRHTASRTSCVRTRRERTRLRARHSQRHPPPTATFPRCRHTILTCPRR
jgi:hypothetical protein